MSQESAVRGQERRVEDFLQLLQPKTIAEKLFAKIASGSAFLEQTFLHLIYEPS